jgi:uncharacterized delta-60 repeat protein
MRIRFATVVLVLFMLAACSAPNIPLAPEPSEQSLFSDADLDKATSEAFSSSSVEIVQELDALNGTEIDESSGTIEPEEINAQAVLPGATGIIAYIRYTPTAAAPYNIVLFNQATDAKTTVYSGTREIDSVAVDGLGASVVFSARQTTSATSDFEVYQLTLSPRTVKTLTNNTSNDTNVSISADAAIIAWEGLHATTSTRQVQWLETATSKLKTLTSSVNDTMPSISGNATYLAFIRTLSTGAIRVQVYKISTSTLTTLTSSTTPKRHPSVSDDGGRVAWTETTATTTRVFVKNPTTGVTIIAVDNVAGVEHAHLRKDGTFLTYGLLQSGKWQLYTRNLATNTSLKGISSTTADARGMFWAPSFLDTTFGTGGVVFTDFGDRDRATALKIDSTGRLVVAGEIATPDGSDWDMGVVRYNTNGGLDTSFGMGGKVTTGVTGNTEFVNDVTIDNNGKILSTGVTFGFPWDYITARFNTDGTPDSGFGTNGVVLTDFGVYDDTAKAVAVDSNNKIVVAGTVLTDLFDVSGSYDFGLARYNPNGSLDSTFGNIIEAPGLVVTDFGETYEEAKDMVLTSTGITVVGDHRVDVGGPNDSTDLIIARYTSSTGLLDPSFGSGGKVITDFAGVREYANSAVIDSSNKLIVVGSIDDNPDIFTAEQDILLVRYNTDGSLDTTFGSGGKVATDIGGVVEEATAVSIDSNGRIVVVGNTNVSICGRIFVARYNPNGTLDNSFGINGKYIPNFSSCNEVAYDLAIDSNGKLVVAGYISNTFTTGTDDFIIARFNP